MILTDYLLPTPSLQWDYARQVGVRHAVIRLPEDGTFDEGDPAHWQSLIARYTQRGFTPLVVEPMPNRLHDSIKAGDQHRDANIDQVINMLAAMQGTGITTICTNFMAHIGWYRTQNAIPERGGALVTGFDQAEVPDTVRASLTAGQVWANLTYFLRAVAPAAEHYGFRIALHPDDPPVPMLMGVARVLTSPENIQRALDIAASPNVGVTLCQGTYSAMGADVCAAITRFAVQDKLFFVHFRDIRGTRERFHETFHDNGQTDMAAAIRAYRDVGYAGPVRVDHVPTMAGEENTAPGYASVGRLFALGYLKGLLEGLGYPYA